MKGITVTVHLETCLDCTHLKFMLGTPAIGGKVTHRYCAHPDTDGPCPYGKPIHVTRKPDGQVKPPAIPKWCPLRSGSSY